MEDVTKMKVADLKRELKNRNLSTIGNKTELMERLQAALIDGVEADELLDESVLTDEDEANILAEDDELLQSPKSLKINLGGEAKPDEDDLLLSPNATTAPKKVVLKRKSSFKDIEETGTAKENTQPIAASTEPKVLKMSERNPITISGTENKDENKSQTDAKAGTVKLSQLTEKERMEMRAKKFGQTAPVTTAPGAATVANVNVSNDQLERLKKRAERFGVVSPTVAKLDETEKLLKRKERFGLDTKVTTSGGNVGGTVSGSGKTDEWAEKARLRAERFKTIAPITTSDAEKK